MYRIGLVPNGYQNYCLTWYYVTAFNLGLGITVHIVLSETQIAVGTTAGQGFRHAWVELCLVSYYF